MIKLKVICTNLSLTHGTPVKGKCLHDCSSYCYMKGIRKRFNQIERESYFDKKELKANLGNGNFIFVGSSCDMWASDIPDNWVKRVIEYCGKYQDNTYIFQTKNPVKCFSPITVILSYKYKMQYRSCH